MSSALKKGYAAGAFDMLMHSGSLGAYDRADERGVLKCALSAGFTPALLAEIVDRRYAQHSEEWNYGAANVMVGAIVDACKVQINEERRKGGLD